MENRVKQILEDRNISVAKFSRDHSITASTLYAIVDGTTKFEKISISTFLKIADGFGMTAEELYYGEDRARRAQYSDPRQEDINQSYEVMNENGRSTLKNVADSLRKDAANRVIEKDRYECDQTALGA